MTHYVKLTSTCGECKGKKFLHTGKELVVTECQNCHGTGAITVDVVCPQCEATVPEVENLYKVASQTTKITKPTAEAEVA